MEVGGWSKKSRIMSTWFLNDPYSNFIDHEVSKISPTDHCKKSIARKDLLCVKGLSAKQHSSSKARYAQ